MFARALFDMDLIIVVGGDGTINEVINGLLHEGGGKIIHRPLLAIIPVGTANVLAQELSIPTNVNDALHRVLTGSPKSIALGRIDSRYFTLMAGVGIDGETVLHVNSKLKCLFGKGAYVMSGIIRLLAHKPPVITVQTGSTKMSGTCAVIGNSGWYAGRFHVTSHAHVTEPTLDICLFRGRGRLALLKFIIGVITRKHLRFRNVYYEKCTSVEITSAELVHVQVDGDYFGTLPARVAIIPDALEVVC